MEVQSPQTLHSLPADLELLPLCRQMKRPEEQLQAAPVAFPVDNYPTAIAHLISTHPCSQLIGRHNLLP